MQSLKRHSGKKRHLRRPGRRPVAQLKTGGRRHEGGALPHSTSILPPPGSRARSHHGPASPAALFSAGTLAEGVGFEPTVGFPTAVFKTAAINRSTTPPGKCAIRILVYIRCRSEINPGLRGQAMASGFFICGGGGERVGAQAEAGQRPTERRSIHGRAEGDRVLVSAKRILGPPPGNTAR